MRKSAFLLLKDLRVLRRSPLLLGVLVAYPLVIAALVGLVATYSTSKPRVALVDEDGLPRVVHVGGERFQVDRTIAAVSENVNLIRGLDRQEALRQLETGKLVAVLIVPEGFIRTLEGLARSPELRFRNSRGPLSSRVEQQVQALVYSLNRLLQEAFIEANLEYVDLIRDGGTGEFLGEEFQLLGLDGVERLLEELPRGPRLDEIRNFVRTARLALAETDDALRATANPIELVQSTSSERSWALSAQVQAYALSLAITFLALLLAAGALAAERDENVITRLARGLVSLGQIVAAKVALAAAVALALGFAMALVFGVAVELDDAGGGQPWARLPLLLLGVALAGAAVGALGAAIGALARDARTASLVAVLVVLPIVCLGLIPREVVPPAGWISDWLPFAHAVRFFGAALYDVEPWAVLLREGAWLAGLGLAFGALARLAARRLLA